ncbi:MAG: cell division protein FtsL [Albidovulum sp.]
MRNLMVFLSAIAVMTLAFWAYRENYRTQAEIAQVRALQREIGQLRENLGVLRAEWAYVNRPDRLRELADINFDRLGLLPLEPRQFGDVETLSYPALALPPITEPIDTIAMGEVEQ